MEKLPALAQSIITYECSKLWRWDLAYCPPYEIGQLLRYNVKPKSTHRFKQEGLRMVTFTPLSSAA